MMSAKALADSVLLTLGARVAALSFIPLAGFILLRIDADHGEIIALKTRDIQYQLLASAISAISERVVRVETIVQRLPDIDRKLDSLIIQKQAQRAADLHQTRVFEPLHIPPVLP
jgi:hypothetical protein